MDPKSTTLDPKLKEVYDRVMGTSAGTHPSNAITPPPQPAAPIPPQMPNSAPHATPLATTAAPAHDTATTNASTAGAAMPAAHSPSAFPPPKSSLDASAPAKSAVDYAALAAKYATPPPPLSESQSAAVGTPFTPPVTGGGFVPPAPPATPTHSDSAQQATNAATHANTTGKSDPNVATFNATVQVPNNSSVPATKNSSALLKIALIVGVPVFLIAYTVVWTIVFKVDLMKFIPGA